MSLVGVNALSSTPILAYRQFVNAYDLSPNQDTSMNPTAPPPAGSVYHQPDVFRDP